APHRDSDEVRYAPARGGVVARHRRGRRPRDLRAQVPWCGAGAQGAHRGACRGRDRARSGPRGAGDRARPRPPRPRPGRARPRDTGPPARERGPQPRPGLPARLFGLRPARGASRRRPRLAHPVVRRARAERGQDPPQHEPARLAWEALAHRPRRLALLPPQLAGTRRALARSRRPEALRGGPRPRPAALRRWDLGGRRGPGPTSDGGGPGGGSRLDPGRVARGRARVRGSRRRPLGVPLLPHLAAAGAARVGPRARRGKEGMACL
ncbi:MAG: FIG00537295: hypothetical protein, partial [uncultured Rubrobacteraceae bacterium]